MLLKQSIIVCLSCMIMGCAAKQTAVFPIQDEFVEAGMKEIKRGTNLYIKGCYDPALNSFFRAHELLSKVDYTAGVAVCLNNIGNIYRLRGDIEAAVAFYDEANYLYKTLNDVSGMIQTLSNKAATLIDNADFQNAKPVLDRADRLCEENAIAYVPLISNKVFLMIKQSKYTEAQNLINPPLMHISSYSKSDQAALNFAAGRLMLAKKEYDRAIDFFTLALERDKSTCYYRGIPEDLTAIAQTYLESEQYPAAVDFLKRSVKLLALHGDHDEALRLLEMLDHAGKEADISISIVKYFTHQWLQGHRFTDICE